MPAQPATQLQPFRFWLYRPVKIAKLPSPHYSVVTRQLHDGIRNRLKSGSGGSVCFWGMPMLTVTSSVAGVADVVLVHVGLERAGSLHER